MPAKGAEIAVKGDRGIDFQARHYAEAGAIGKTENFIVVAQKQRPRGLFVFRRDFDELGEFACEYLFAEFLGINPSQAVTKQCNGLVQDEIASNKPILIAMQTLDYCGMF